MIGSESPDSYREFTESEVTLAMQTLVKAGMEPSVIVAGGLAGTLSIAGAGLLGVEDAAVIAAEAIETFQISDQRLVEVEPRIIDVTRLIDTPGNLIEKAARS